MTAARPSHRPSSTASERLIVALDVPTPAEALAIVGELGELVSFYKIGLELLMSGAIGDLLRELARDKRVFVDLKLPNDIPETVRRVVQVAADLGAELFTLSHSASRATIDAALRGRGGRSAPALLFVPVLSSVDEADFGQVPGGPAGTLRAEMLRRARDAKKAGVDGFVVSGEEIGVLRAEFPDAVLVSPGIRPAGAPRDDHKRSSTAFDAIRMGADCIVVGRPVRDAPSRRDAARAMIDEVARAAARA